MRKERLSFSARDRVTSVLKDAPPGFFEGPCMKCLVAPASDAKMPKETKARTRYAICRRNSMFLVCTGKLERTD